jgi:hypothetical protein
MDMININFVNRSHCPNCNVMYIIIDNEIILCPNCEVNSHCNESKFYEDNSEKELVQFQF